MWLQYSVGGISGALAGLTGFYLLKEIVIERERRFYNFDVNLHSYRNARRINL